MQASRPVTLVVDDDPETSQVLRTLLESAGYTVECAADGASALVRIQAGGVDLVLLDLMLPEMDGLEVCGRVRAGGGEIYQPILMVTALGRREERADGFAVGADDYVTKPFDADELLNDGRPPGWCLQGARGPEANPG